MAVVDPAGHTYPAAHGPLQLALGMAAVAPYRPDAHTLQDPAPPTLYWPAGQVAAVALVDPATHAYPGLQVPEQADVERPGTAP